MELSCQEPLLMYLPISTIDDIKLDSVNNKIIRKVSKGYENKMKEYIKSKTL